MSNAPVNYQPLQAFTPGHLIKLLTDGLIRKQQLSVTAQGTCQVGVFITNLSKENLK